MRLNKLSKYFYSDGIKFKCQKCGACCNIEDGVVYLLKKDIYNLSSFFNIEIGEFKDKYTTLTEEGSFIIKDIHSSICRFQKNNRCSVYPARPTQCRLYPFWSTLMKDRSLFYSENCPGIGKGNLVDFEKITDSIIKHRKFLNELERI